MLAQNVEVIVFDDGADYDYSFGRMMIFDISIIHRQLDAPLVSPPPP
jgi:hypothetical protein